MRNRKTCGYTGYVDSPCKWHIDPEFDVDPHSKPAPVSPTTYALRQKLSRYNAALNLLSGKQTVWDLLEALHALESIAHIEDVTD